MNCPKCQHEDYTVNTTASANSSIITFTITVPSTAASTAPVPTMQFHLDCECCKAGHK